MLLTQGSVGAGPSTAALYLVRTPSKRTRCSLGSVQEWSASAWAPSGQPTKCVVSVVMAPRLSGTCPAALGEIGAPSDRGRWMSSHANG